ncbi:MAG: glycosyltransferase [candidate division WOR-3 bacterium]|nr:glycosyltransferase [candidate division WOR-3 bacterium]
MVSLNNYTPIVSQSTIDELYLLGKKLRDKVVQNINSTAVGGGVAEILTKMVPLLKELGVDARWDVIKGDGKFFSITKKIHNALHGVDIELSKEELDYFKQVNHNNAGEINFYGDIVYIHDPQPIALVDKRKEVGKKWVWRCHIDFTEPNQKIFDFLRRYIEQYDCAVFSAPAFSRELNIPQILVSPSIDPLSDKNKELPQATIDSVLERFEIDSERPIVTQISRFDYLKDPLGVIEVYKKVKKYIDFQLILAGGGATDDPEGMKVLEEVKAASTDDPDIHVIFLPPASDIEINALQRASSVILQKSLKEGFGLTVAEALWKRKPVIASAVGGIPLQIAHKYSGILSHSIEGTAFYLKQLLNDPDYAMRLGLNGKEHIRNNFLITRHIRDYLLLFISLFYESDVINL